MRKQDLFTKIHLAYVFGINFRMKKKKNASNS